MKIRNGFVSNSSSSSFLIDSIPATLKIEKDSFVNDDASLEELCDIINEDDNELLADDIVDKFNNYLESLRLGRPIYHDNVGELFMPLLNFLESNNLVMMTMDGAGGDGEDTIIPFKDRRIKK
jgi:hypothetical protein